MRVHASGTMVRIGLLAIIVAMAVPHACTIADEPKSQPATNEIPGVTLEEKIELAEIRLAIRLQKVEVAKAERRLLVRPTRSATEDQLAASKAKLVSAESNLKRLKTLHQEAIIGEQQVQRAEAVRRAAEAEYAAREAEAEYAAREAGLETDVSGQRAVQDERIKLLELRAKMAEARLNQLKSRLRGD